MSLIALSLCLLYGLVGYLIGYDDALRRKKRDK